MKFSSSKMFLAIFATFLFVYSTAAGDDDSVAASTQPATQPAGREDEQAQTITITGKKSPVEQGEKSNFTAQGPRDLIKRPLSESPGLDTAQSVVGKEEMEWLDAYSVIDALKYVPGAWTESRGRKVKKFFSVRGQRYPYPGYLIDGAWFREFHETGYFISTANLERLEVLRSSGAMMLSPGGMSGMINIIPRTYTKRRTNIKTLYGSHNTSRTDLSHGDVIGELSYAIGAGYKHTDGPDGENANENITNLYSRIVASPTPEWTFSVMGMSFFGDRSLQLAEPPAQARFRTESTNYDPMKSYLFVGKARYQPSDRAATEIIANYAQRRFHGHTSGSDDWLEDDFEYGARITQTLKLCEKNTLRFGGLFNNWISPTGKRFYVGNPADLWTYSGIIVDEHDFGNLILNAGYRLSRTYYNEFGGFNVEGSPKGGLRNVKVQDEWRDPLHTFTLGGVYKLPKGYSIHANVTRGQLEANPGMLDTDLQQPGTETRTKCDLGLKREWDRFGEASLTAFYVHQQDAAVLTRQTVTVNGNEFGLFENTDRDNYGLELDVRSKRFDNGLQFFFNAVGMQTEKKEDGVWVEDEEVPNIILGGGVSYLIKNVEFSVLAKRVSQYENQRFLASGSAPVDLGDFTEVNTKVTYYFGEDKQHYVFFGVDNIFDEHYSTVVGWPNEGATFKSGLGLKF